MYEYEHKPPHQEIKCGNILVASENKMGTMEARVMKSVSRVTMQDKEGKKPKK